MDEIFEPRSPAVASDATATATLVLEAAPLEVWRALTTERGLAPWMGEGASVEAEPGGLVVLPDPVGGVTRRGRVERVDSQRLLEFAWWPALKPAERTTVSISLAPEGSGTRVTVNEWPPSRATRSARSVLASAVVSDPAGRRPTRRSSDGQRPRPLDGRTIGPVTSMLGAWTWRLAVLSLSCSLARI